jgi:hypothetical protein
MSQASNKFEDYQAAERPEPEAENCSIGARLKINRLQNLNEIHLQFN